MKIYKAFKYRIYPNKTQQAALAVQFGHARFVYNWALARRKEHYRETGQGLHRYDQQTELKDLKSQPETEWLKQGDSQVLQAKLQDLDRAYVNFFEGRAKYPKFKKKFAGQSIRYPQRFKVEGSRVYLPKVGRVRTIFHRPIEGKMKNCTVSKTKSGQYYVSIQCQVEMREPSIKPGQVGIDLGLKHFAVLSNGQKIDHPKYLRKAEKKLARLQRSLSRKKKGSNSRNKARLKVARQHQKIANQRKDFLHKLSAGIVANFGHVSLEDLNVRGMVKNRSLAKSISDSGWYEFGRQLEYKGQWYGSNVVKIDRWTPSSKTCSVCGWVNQDLELCHRFWLCLSCDTTHDRDINAALNIDRVGVTRINAGGDCVSPIAPLQSAVVGEAGSPIASSLG